MDTIYGRQLSELFYLPSEKGPILESKFFAFRAKPLQVFGVQESKQEVTKIVSL